VKTQHFVYTTYIQSVPQIVWHALVDPEMTKQYWSRHQNVSDWRPGSSWKHVDYDRPGLVDLAGRVLESLPPRRLVLSWAFPEDLENEPVHSRVAIDIVTEAANIVRLTLIHSGLEFDSEMYHGIAHGWPRVLSSLKSLIETGHALPITAVRPHPVGAAVGRG
jgi:uncharacterized protein YndB with AHSA1/START domain